VGGTYTKSGTHLHDKNTKRIYGWFTGCCRGVVITVNRRQTRPQVRQAKSRTWCLPVWLHLPEPLFDYATSMWPILTPASTSSSSSPSKPQTDTSAKHPDSPFRQLQQPTTTIRETATHLRLSTHFTKVSRRYQSHRFLSFHTDIIFRTDCDVTKRLWRNDLIVTSRYVTMRYNTSRRNQNVLRR